jgi:hypothetical protein
MKTKILQKAIVSTFVLLGLAMLLVAGTRDGRGFVGVDDALLANTISVTNTNDSGPGSLRDALAVARDGDKIDATGASGTILLTSGELQITHNVTIKGPGAGHLAVNGNATSRVFENFASNVTISGFTITNGFSSNNLGGGILNHGGLTLSDSIINNSLAVSGGGIACDGGGILTVTDSNISGNGAGGIGGQGGGIYTDGTTVIVINSTISGNGATCGGGGINIDNAQVKVINSTISGNQTTQSGTRCGQRPSYGGGINIYNAQVKVINSTFSGNSADSGGAIYNGGTTTIGDTILNAGASGGTIDNGGTVTSLGYNLASDNGGGVLNKPGDQINTDPMLGPLQNNGGLTLTHALLPGSPAVDAGDPNSAPRPFYDQRGPFFFRVVNHRVDIGSFEVQPPPSQRPRL